MRPVLAGIVMTSPVTDTDPADMRAARVRKALRDQPGVLIHERAPGEASSLRWSASSSMLSGLIHMNRNR